MAGAAPAIPLLRFFEELVEADDIPALERIYWKGVGEFVEIPMGALYLFGKSGEVERIASENVSDVFLARYEEIGRPIDPLLEHTLREGAPADNVTLMTVEQWRATTLFQEVLRLHGVIYGLEAPVLCGDRMLGTMAWGTDQGRGPATPEEHETAAALGRVVGIAVDVVRRRELAVQAQEQMAAALDRSPTPVAISDGRAGHRHLNASARALLDRIVDGESWVDRLTARSGGRIPRAAEAEVPLVGGGRVDLEIESQELAEFPATTISVLRLAGVTPRVPVARLDELTAREREVAVLVAEALSDAEIAERLYLSAHTVHQHLKTIYRKLGISSRVALTRLVLTEPGAG
jgi:DNA-binding CsgD family transcriptional regulator